MTPPDASPDVSTAPRHDATMPERDGSTAARDSTVARADGSDAHLTASDTGPDVKTLATGDALADGREIAEAARDAPKPADAAAVQCAVLPSNSLAVAFADSVLARWPNPGTLSGSNPPAWQYNAGIVLHGLEEVYRRTSNPSYLAYIQQYVDAFVDASGTVTMPVAFSFDNIEPAILLPFLWQETAEAKYRAAAKNIRTLFNTIPTNASGGFWHKSTYPDQMWLDGIYMGEPFLARYGAVFDCDSDSFCFDTATFQISLLASHAQTASVSGLLFHAWDESKKAAWADPTTGLSPEVWGRGQGWFAMALVDVLGYMPASYAGRSQLLVILQNLAAGLKASQDPVTGLWYEVVTPGTCQGDWLESSGSSMYVYAIRIGVDRGYLDPTYASVAAKGWAGLQNEVTMDSVGPVINHAVQGLDPQTSCAGYVNATALSDSTQGECGILLAASVMEATCP